MIKLIARSTRVIRVIKLLELFELFWSTVIMGNYDEETGTAQLIHAKGFMGTRNNSLAL